MIEVPERFLCENTPAESCLPGCVFSVESETVRGGRTDEAKEELAAIKERVEHIMRLL